MKFRTGIILFIGLLNSFLSFGQKEIDYHNKALLKALQKSGVSDISGMIEISIPNSISDYNINGKYFIITEMDISEYQYIYVGRVNSCRAGGCSITNEFTATRESEYFDYYILFDKNKTIQTVKVFNYQATHGQEISVKGWLKQFIGYDGSDPLQVGKNIDAISGATISVYAITIDIEIKTEILKLI